MSWAQTLREEAAGAGATAQLDPEGRFLQTRAFVRDPVRNHIRAGAPQIELSSIFKWFRDDFGGSDDAADKDPVPGAPSAEEPGLWAGGESPKLVEALNSETSSRRNTAAVGLDHSGGAALHALPALTRSLEHADPELRWWLCDILTNLGPLAAAAAGFL